MDVTIVLIVLCILIVALLGGALLSVAKSRAALASEVQRLQSKQGELKHQGAVSASFASEDDADRLRAEARSLRESVDGVRKVYEQKRGILDRLEQQLAIYDERLALAEMGLYQSHFSFGDSEDYKRKILEVRQKQRDMIAAKIATKCPSNWTVDGSAIRGMSLITNQMKLSLRAFNGECDAAITNVAWNNVLSMEKRIHAAAKAINSANESMRVSISDGYVRLKIEELLLSHEYKERMRAEKAMRDEAASREKEKSKLMREADIAERKTAELFRLLSSAREGQPENKPHISALESQLAAARAASERARALLGVVHSGYVYVVSNIGSFGEGVFKVGMTKRAEPEEFLQELSHDSLPFEYDIHMLAYSEEASAIVEGIHNEFAEKRVNSVNMSKSFFRVSLGEVEAALGRILPGVSFSRATEAREWKETLALVDNDKLKAMAHSSVRETALPDEI